MKRKKHVTDEMIRKLREAEAMEASGQTVGAICQKLKVSEATLARRSILVTEQFRAASPHHRRRDRVLGLS